MQVPHIPTVRRSLSLRGPARNAASSRQAPARPGGGDRGGVGGDDWDRPQAPPIQTSPGRPHRASPRGPGKIIPSAEPLTGGTAEPANAPPARARRTTLTLAAIAPAGALRIAPYSWPSFSPGPLASLRPPRKTCPSGCLHIGSQTPPPVAEGPPLPLGRALPRP